MRLPLRHPIATLMVSILAVWTIAAQVRPDVTIIRFPAHEARDVSPDTPLRLTFAETPIAGTSGEVRVYDVDEGQVVDRLDLAIPAGPTQLPPATATSNAGPPPVYQRTVIGRINPEAWQLPDDPGRVRYWESGSISLDTGRPADVSARHRASRQLDRTRDAEIIAQYRDPAFALGGWMPEMAPIVLSAPDHTAVPSGATISLAVTVAAIPQATYEWRRGTTVIADDGRVTGARTRVLSIKRAVRGDAGQYRVTVSNRAGQAVSSAVQVSVQ